MTDDLLPNAANFTPLTPLSFLRRAAAVYPDKTAVIYNTTSYTYSEFYRRCRQLADALRRDGIQPGDTVAIMSPNIPPLLEAHYGVPMAGAVLNALNTRLDPAALATFLRHGEAKLLIVDREYLPTVTVALQQWPDRQDQDFRIVEIADIAAGTERSTQQHTEYEDFIAEGDASAAWSTPSDEWQPIALNYTSGTSGNPKGVVYHHRGAYLNAMSNAILFALDRHSVYLWTLPMFHCNGWCFTWAVTLVGGTHVCLRRADPLSVFEAIEEHPKVSHLCAAPIVLNVLVQAAVLTKHKLGHIVNVATGGAAPPAAIISGAERLGFDITHLYGLTESFGPSAVCAWQHEWGRLDLGERARLMARQGVPNLVPVENRVVDRDTMQDLPADGESLGELVLRGNSIMAGYLKNPDATAAAFAGGWYHTGDLAVRHPDGYIEIKDRAKDIVIVGGDNVSSLEIEECLYRHPAVSEAAVVAKPDTLFGEVPAAFVVLKPDTGVTPDMLTAWCRDQLAVYKVPRVMYCEASLPKTATGKIEKFRLRQRVRSDAGQPARD